MYSVAANQLLVGRDEVAEPRANPLITLGLFLLTGVACYVGQQLSYTLRFTPLNFTTIWFPGGIVLAVLLVYPYRLWPILCIGSSIGIFAALIPDYPLLNAVLGGVMTVGYRVGIALIVRWLCFGSPRFDYFRDMLIFVLVACIVSPPMFNFLSAWIAVMTGLSTDYWLVWRTISLAELLGHLTITPAVVVLLQGEILKLKHVSRWRYLEAAALGLTLVPRAWNIFGNLKMGPLTALIHAPLPVLVWAAVRFGPGGTALMLLAISSLFSWDAVRGQGPFGSGRIEENVPALQLYLTFMAVPVLLLSTLIRERQGSSFALRNSERRYREVVDSQRELVCRYLQDTTLTFVNDAYCRYFGRTRKSLIGTRFVELIPEAARSASIEHANTLARDGHVKPMTHQVILPGGKIGWQEWIDYAIVGPDGQIVEFQGIGRDVTELKRAEESLRASESELHSSNAKIQDLAGRLITAEEGERKRIARELHDGVNQQLAGLSIRLSGIKRQLPEAAVALQQEVVALQNDTIEVSEAVRSLSHELHPGILQHTGLVPALKAHCIEFKWQMGIETSFTNDGDTTSLSPDLSLCLYRVAQEALRNVAIHAKASRVDVSLMRDQQRLRLCIADDGRGFDPAKSHESRGLGLLSIEERIRLVQGELTIESKPQLGTVIYIDVPMEGGANASGQSLAGG